LTRERAILSALPAPASTAPIAAIMTLIMRRISLVQWSKVLFGARDPP